MLIYSQITLNICLLLLVLYYWNRARSWRDTARYWRSKINSNSADAKYMRAVDTAIFNLERIAAGSTPEHVVLTFDDISDMARVTAQLLRDIRDNEE